MQISVLIYKFAPFGSYYMVIDGMLCKVDVTDIVIDFQEEMLSYRIKTPDGAVHMVNKRDADFYNSKEDFEKDITVTHDHGRIHVRNLLTEHDIITSTVKNEKGQEVIVPSVWVFNDGEPKQIVVDLHCYEFSKGNGCWHGEFKYYDDWNGNEMLPQNRFMTREQAFLWNDYKITEGDGTQRIVKSKMGKLFLNDEQKKAIDVIQKAFEDARSLGIQFAWLDSVCGLSAFSTRYVSEAANDSIDTDEGVCLDDRTLKKAEFITDIKVSDFYVNDCDYGVVIRKFKGEEK